MIDLDLNYCNNIVQLSYYQTTATRNFCVSEHIDCAPGLSGIRVVQSGELRRTSPTIENKTDAGILKQAGYHKDTYGMPK